jgi:hypothetical protein
MKNKIIKNCRSKIAEKLKKVKTSRFIWALEVDTGKPKHENQSQGII